jgi:hypothetical protein
MNRILIIVLIAFSFLGCDKKKVADLSANNMDFTSIRKYDVNHNYLGYSGDVSNEYVQEDWPDWVYQLLSPLDSTNLDGYDKADVSITALYPNPCSDTQSIRLFASKPENLKVVIIDKNKNVYLLQSMHLYLGDQFKHFDYSKLNMTPGYYRMFYAISAHNDPCYTRGHIDIYKQY